ncbi:hypothetical protein TPMD03_74 [Thiohalocapsa phage LS06-2018-MD03]|nr:hypothetical protein TPMD03_74 [Thiohalocapsa phage LS06-2018-MD03]
MSNPKKIDKFKRLNDCEIEQNKVFMSLDGIILIFEDDLAKVIGVSKRMLQNYKEDGLEHHPLAVKGAVVYDLIYALKWLYNVKDKVISTKQKTPIKKDSAADFNMKMLLLDHETKEQKLETDKLKHAILKKEYVKAEDLDRSTAEQAVVHKAQYLDDLEMLPTLLENRSREEIDDVLQEHYASRMESISKFIDKQFELPNTFHNIILKFIKDNS